jgi:GT2 family glycosyltransferase
MKKAILVLGPPRSGTSVVSHVIHKLGVDFGNHDRFVDPKVHTYNPIFFELQSLNNLNDEIFAHFSKTFFNFDWVPNESVFDNAVIKKFEKKIIEFIDGEFSKSGTIGLKDTRFCFTLPIWDVVLKRLGFDVRYVLSQRFANSVFVSNKIANQSSSELNFRIVVQSTLLARHYLEAKKHVIVRYEDLLADPDQSILRLCDGLSLDRVLIGDARSVISEDLNHQKRQADLFTYHYFENVIDSDLISPDEYLRYREIFLAATSEMDQRSASLSQTVSERDGQVASLRDTVSERDGQVASLRQTVSERDGQVASLRQTVSERDGQVASLRQTVSERDGQVASLSQTVSERDGQVASLSQNLQAYQDSTSWRITRPVRFVGWMFKRIERSLVLFGALFLNLKNLKTIAIKLNRKGLAGVVHHSQLLQSEEYVAEVSRVRGLSPEFLRLLVILAKLFLTIKQWWFANHLRSKFTERLLDFFQGIIRTSRKIEISHLRFHIDKPHKLFNTVDGSLVISGWCVDIDANAAGNVRVRIGKAVYHPHQKQREDVQRAFELVCKLPIDCGFAVVPSLPIGLHRMWIDIEGSDGTWIPVRRALLLRIPRTILGHPKQSLSYKSWVRIEQKRLKTHLSEISRHIDVMIHRPVFTIVIDARQSDEGWEKSLQSICEQIYPHYELRTLINVGTKLPTSLEQATKVLDSTSFIGVLTDFMIFIECGQKLSSNALYEFANAINQDPDLDLIYGDEDHLNASLERCNPFYKPDWSPDYLETFNYIGSPACFRSTLLRGFSYNTNLYDLTLRVTECTTKICHIAKILMHSAKRHVSEEVLQSMSAQNIAALQGRLNRTGRQGTVREHELHCGCYDIQITLKREPFVSVIIPTAGKIVTVEDRQIDLITNITNQIINQSTYKNIEIIVVDNGDLSESQQQALSDQGCKLITYTNPIFNISNKLNLGVSIAKGELLLLMNDDIEILFPAWIERMVEHFEKPHVGVVGAKLLYPDGRTQHVGVVHNYGNPDHVSRLQSKEEAGYYFSTCGVRNFMGVTGAVMMTPSNIYRVVGGYSEELAVSYNDADYCLKVQEKGLWIVYAPKVELTHMESQSRVASADMAEVAWYHKQWASKTILDPYYNEQFLAVASPTFVPSVNQRLV